MNGKKWNGQGKEFGGIDDILISKWEGMNIHFGWKEGLKPSSTEQIGNQTVKTNYKKGHYRWRHWGTCINMQRIFKRNKRSEVLTKKEWKGGAFGTFLRGCFGLLWTWSAGWFAKINIIWRWQLWWLQVDAEEDLRRDRW